MWLFKIRQFNIKESFFYWKIPLPKKLNLLCMFRNYLMMLNTSLEINKSKFYLTQSALGCCEIKLFILLKMKHNYERWKRMLFPCFTCSHWSKMCKKDVFHGNLKYTWDRMDFSSKEWILLLELSSIFYFIITNFQYWF